MSSTAIDLLLADEASRPRADARRNVERLVMAAREALDETGLDATAHEIARRAGVGIGTLYRRVGTREALLRAVLLEFLGGMLTAADRALDADDAWQGLVDFATVYVRLRAASCGVNEALGDSDARLDLSETSTALRERLERLVGKAQEAGAMRTDVTWQDTAWLLAGVVPGDHTIGLTPGGEQWRIGLRVVLDGLRA
ncbi:TetR/AcrR family transcriptional regulator [Phytomonospora endophytica]|uniref:AcrR family transcriptional regulator n=1 Tax=Phytomonospora endophytica TaxID=714109 RepID=A0A841FRA6_9ACTN|nr:TetR/AcrR family transcriptional regulator [Phytomonospora endophytica]MBB6038745.1 AcrR family transcriptional regulator [Phytomonospora endophytica]